MFRPLKKVIFLTTESPYPPDRKGKYREIQLIEILSEQMEVELLCFAKNTESSPSSLSPPPKLRISRVTRDPEPTWKKTLSLLRPFMMKGYSKSMAEALKKKAEPGKLLWVSRLSMAPYIPIAHELGYRIVFEEHQIENSVIPRTFSPWALSSLLISAQSRYYESHFCTQSDVVVTHNAMDATRLGRLAPGALVHVIPNSIDCSRYLSLRSKLGSILLFCGNINSSRHLEGLLWFGTEVLPRLRAALGAKLPRIVAAGTSPPPPSSPLEGTLERLRKAGIEIHCHPEPLNYFLPETGLVIAPVHTEIQQTILEAMAAGRPVVSTGKAVEGLALSPTYDIWIADDADGFTSAILRLLEDPKLREESGSRAAHTIETRYDSQRLKMTLQLLLTTLSVPPTQTSTLLRSNEG